MFNLLINKYKSLFSYIFFGVCTTIVNVVVYSVCYQQIGISNVPSTVIAWIAAVLFAYITNKLFVFESKSFQLNVLKHEITAFFGCRLLTGILDIAIMFIAVDKMSAASTVWKIISNILVIILNYAASKMIIFKQE